MYFYGEIGYEEDGESASISLAESAAIELSLERSTTTIAVWDRNEDVLSVAIDGEIYDRRTS